MFKIGKVVKIIIIVPLCLLLLVFAALLITPIFFKGQIMDIAKTQLNKMFLAKIEFSDLKLSFIRNFPNAYIALEGLEVTGVGDFEGELLAAFDQFSVTADIMSFIKKKEIDVKSVLLDHPRINGHILEDGRANWNIMKPGEDTDEEEETTEDIIAEAEETETEKEDSDLLPFKVGLSSLEIRKMEITFLDEAHKMKAGVRELNFALRGDMAKSNVDLKMELGIDGIDFWLNGVRMANQASVGFISEIAADLKNMFFVIKDNRFNLNDIVLKFGGSVGMQGEDINADVAFSSERTDFKSLLSLVPAIYMHDFQDLTATGSFALSGDVKGTYNKTTMPSANVSFSVYNAMFKYPILPKSVDKINIDVKAHYDGVVFDRTTADLNRLSFEMAGNPFNMEAHVKTPESDLQVSAGFAGKIDFDSIMDIVPLDDINVHGLLECDLSLAGRLSTLQNEQYEDFQAAGSVKLSRFDFETAAFPHGIKINSTELNFTPRLVDLAHFNATVGNSDLSLNGSLQNFIPFVLKNETVRGSLALKSNTINLNDFMGGDSDKEKKVEEKPETGESEPLSVIEVPKNIDFAVAVNIGQIFFDKLVISNTVGALSVKDGRVEMKDLAMNLLEGSMTLNGEYNTQNIQIPFIDFGMNIRQFDISTALSSLSMLEKILPEPQNYVGRVSATLTLYSVLDEHLSPVLNSVASKGRLQTQNLEIRNSKIFGSLADLLKNERWRTPAPGNLNIGYEIKDGRLWIEEPIVFNISPAKMEIKGDQGLDMTLNYKVDATTPVSTLGSGAVSLLSNIPGASGLKEIKLTGLVKGTVKDPDISLSIADMTSSIASAVREQVTERVTQIVDTARTQVNTEINRQIDQIMAEAQKQADTIRSTGKQAADRVRREANAAADRTIAEAAKVSNPVAKAAAQVTAKTSADKMRSEGEANAKKLEQEADAKARAVLAEAEKRADQLRRQ